jgi:membrane-associated phospholipid phosphatase
VGTLTSGNSRPWLLYLLGYGYVIGIYLVTNHQTWQTPHLLPMTWIDNAVPFMPWTGWIYATVYVMPILPTVFVSERREILGMVWAFVGAATVCFTVFLIYPTVFPRPSLDHTGFSSLALYWFHQVDTPQNCLPSGHVAFSFLSAFIMQRYNAKWGGFLVLWAFVIAVTTLTTKQHYLWDVVTGYFLARVTFVLVERYWFTRSATVQ